MTGPVRPRGRRAADAVAGLAAMLGAGVFIGPASTAAAAGQWLLAGVAVAALIAWCDAHRAAARPPGTPGTPIARVAAHAALAARLLAGAAIAGAFGAYVVPGSQRTAAVFAILLTAALVIAGCRPPPALLAVSTGLVVVVLALVAAVCFAIDPVRADVPTLPAATPGLDDPASIPLAAGIALFWFAGHGRAGQASASAGRSAPTAARLGWRVAVPVAAVIYLVVAAAALYQLNGPRLALSPAPLRSALAAADGSALVPAVIVAAAIATLSALFAVIDALRPATEGWPDPNAGPGPDRPRRVGRGGRPTVTALGAAAMAIVAVLVRPDAAMTVSACFLLAGCALGALDALRSRRLPRRSPPVLCTALGLVLCLLAGAAMPVDSLAMVAAVLGGSLLNVLTAGRARR